MSSTHLLPSCIILSTVLCGFHSHVSVESNRNAVWDDPSTYLNDVTQTFASKVYDHGVGNLPVDDVTKDVNDTRYNIQLLGQLSYTHGAVLDIQNITMYYRDYIWYVNEDVATLLFKIQLSNISVDYNLDAALEVADIRGNAALVYPENIIDVHIFKNGTSSDPEVYHMGPGGVKAPRTVFTPDSDVMRAIADNARLTMSGALFEELETWIRDTFMQILEETINEIPFPIKEKD